MNNIKDGSAIKNLLHGAIDMHVHHGPDCNSDRRWDALELAQLAKAAGMKGIVLKSHLYPTAPLAYIIQQVVPDIAICGSICLDIEVGGFNADAVDASAKLGAKVVWMPTFSSENDVLKRKSSGGPPGGGLIGMSRRVLAKGFTIFDEQGKVLNAVNDILDIIKKYDIVLATGHLSVPEAFTLVDLAVQKGITKIVATHPMMKGLGAYLTVEQQKQMAAKGVFIEHIVAITLPPVEATAQETLAAIRVVGAEHCIMCTDFGMASRPSPVEGMAMFIGMMLQQGLKVEEIELMAKVNPSRLLSI